MSRGWAPDAVIDKKSAGWLFKTGVLDSPTAEALRRFTRGQLWKRWIKEGCRFPEACTSKEGFSFYCRFKILVAGAGGIAHPMAILKRVAAELSFKPATEQNVARLIGPASVDEIAVIQVAQGLVPRKTPRAPRRGNLKELLQVMPVKRRNELRLVFDKAARRGTPIHELHIGRVLNLQPELQPGGALTLLDCSWKGKSPATFQSYLGGLEKVDDFLATVPTMRLHRLLDRLDGKVDSFDQKTLVGLRTFALAIGATRKFVIEQFDASQAVSLFMGLCDPAGLADITKSARKVIDDRDERKGDEREEQVLIDLHQNDRMDRLVKQRQASVELAFDRYVAELKEVGGNLPKAGLSFSVQTPVFDADGFPLGEAEQLVWFRIDTAGNVARRAAARNRPGPMHHTMASTIERLDALRPSKFSELREDLVVLYEGCEALEPDGPTNEPFFVILFRWGVLEGDTRHPPFVQECRQLLLDQVGLGGDWQPIADLLCLPKPLRWVARAARGDDPHLGEIVIPLVGLHHGLLLGRLCHTVVRAACPRTFEVLQVQLGPEYVGKELPGKKGLYPIMMRPKQHVVLKQYNVPTLAMKLIARIVKLANSRWFPEYLGKAHRLPVRPSRLRDTKPLPDGQYVFSHATGALDKAELAILRHVILWEVSQSKIHAGRFNKATAFGLAGQPDNLIAKFLKQKRGSRQPRRYDRSDGLLADAGAHHGANAGERQ